MAPSRMEPRRRVITMGWDQRRFWPPRERARRNVTELRARRKAPMKSIRRSLEGPRFRCVLSVEDA